MIHDMIDVSVSLPRILWEELQGYAQTEHENETHLLIRAIEQFLRQELVDVEQSQPLQHVPNSNGYNQGDDWTSLKQIVAEIRALPANPLTLHRATKSVDQLLAELNENSSTSAEISPEEWDQQWAIFEAEQKAIDLTKDRAEGR